MNGFQTLFELIRRLQKQENLRRYRRTCQSLWYPVPRTQWEITVRVSGRHVIL